MEDEDFEKVVAALDELREDFREYQEFSEQYEREKRVENIQVLIALGVIGGTLTVFTSRLVDTPFWQNVLSSPFWRVILSAFVASNTIFLILKLLTIPLQPVTDNKYIAYIHEVIEPFLYFFSVTGVLLAIIIRFLITPWYHGFQPFGKFWIAIGSLALPFLLGVLYAQAYRINAALRRSRKIIVEINQILEESVREGALSSEERAKLLRDVFAASTPTPVSLYAIFVIQQIISDILKERKSPQDRIETSERQFDDQINTYLKSYTTTSAALPLLIFIFRYLSEKENDGHELSNKERKKLRSKIQNLRNKAVHGQLDEEEIEVFTEYLRQYSQSDDNEEDRPE